MDTPDDTIAVVGSGHVAPRLGEGQSRSIARSYPAGSGWERVRAVLRQSNEPLPGLERGPSQLDGGHKGDMNGKPTANREAPCGICILRVVGKRDKCERTAKDHLEGVSRSKISGPKWQLEVIAELLKERDPIGDILLEKSLRIDNREGKGP